MATTSIGAPGVTFPDASLQTTSGVTTVNGKGPGTVQSILVQGTAVASTSGTSIDFTSIPSWVRRITVMFSGVSASGTSSFVIQIGSGSITSTGYASGSANIYNGGSPQTVTWTTGFILTNATAASELSSGTVVLTLITGNTWVSAGNLQETTGARTRTSGGNVSLSGVLDRLRITTANGTDTFDAGSINILYE